MLDKEHIDADKEGDGEGETHWQECRVNPSYPAGVKSAKKHQKINSKKNFHHWSFPVIKTHNNKPIIQRPVERLPLDPNLITITNHPLQVQAPHFGLILVNPKRNDNPKNEHDINPAANQVQNSHVKKSIHWKQKYLKA